MALSEKIDYATALDYIIAKQVDTDRFGNTLPLTVAVVLHDTCLYLNKADTDVDKILDIFRRAEKITYWHFGYHPDCGRELTCSFSDTTFTVAIDTEKTMTKPEAELASV
jgi:hypothetical protein